jgi:hypothetical protein
MAALKSKAELLSWYNELKTKLRAKEITAIAFEQEIVKNISLLIVGDKKPTVTKLALVADILLSVQYDHFFTSSAFADITQLTTNPLCGDDRHFQNTVQSFISVQTQRRLESEKEQTVKAEAKKTFAKFPTRAEVDQWVSSRKPAMRAVTEAIPHISWKHGDNADKLFFDEVEKQLTAMKLELDRADPNYIDNILIIDYFVSLIASLEIPEQSYQHLVDELRSLYADPVKTPHIDAFIERDKTHPVEDRTEVAVRALQQRADNWAQPDPNNRAYENGGMLQMFADGYCPVATAMQLARTGFIDFVKETVGETLLAVANPVDSRNFDLLSRGSRTSTLTLDNGVLGITTTITRNGVVEFRIRSERYEKTGLRQVSYDHNALRRGSLGDIPLAAMTSQFLQLWHMPNQPARFNRQNGGPYANYTSPSEVNIEEHLLGVLRQLCEQYRVTPTIGTGPDHLLIVLH